MKRSEFTKKLLAAGMCPYLIAGKSNNTQGMTGITTSGEKSDEETTFIENWLSDLLDTMEQELDRKTQVKLMAGCGRGCFNRHQFKIDIAEAGKDNLDNLIAAYSKNFEIWKEDRTVHIRYGKVSSRCYCPVVQNIPPKPKDLHCECTRATHQTIFEMALGRPINVFIKESLRRGGRTCHFLVDVS